jgi:hypothetical protein
MFKWGQINRETALEYVREWNGSRKHFTVAVVYSFSIGLIDPDVPGKLEQIRGHAEANGFTHLYENNKKEVST